jgi:hypothetical protein
VKLFYQWKPGDEAAFGGKTFMLIDRKFGAADQIPMWLAIESGRLDATPRLLVEADLKPILSAQNPQETPN